MKHLHAKEYAELPFTPVFIGGAPRSGTTVLNAYVCSAPEASDLAGEAAYIYHIMPSYARMKAEPELNTYFKDVAEFEEYHAGLLKIILTDMWVHFGKPKVLVLKSPFLTMYFPELLHLLPMAKFLVSLRDIRDVIASRCKVEIKVNRMTDTKPDQFSPQQLNPLCEEYRQVYLPVMLAPAHPNLKIIRYEDFVTGKHDAEIAKFFGITPKPDHLWQSKHVDVSTWHGNEWNSDSYGKERTGDNVGSYKKYFNHKQIEFIERTVKGTPLAVQS
ncbi:MAG: sulfotransferase [Proteobacteria bacterium]|nr:sulfotransferase [Pseudomonadota bacterium]